MKKLAMLALSLVFILGVAVADTPKDSNSELAKAPAPAKAKPAKAAEKSSASLAAEIEELRQAVQSQQEQLQLLKEELAKRDHQIDEARDAAAAANARAAEASSKAIEAVKTSTEVKSNEVAINTTVSDLKASNAALTSTVATAAKDAAAAKANAAQGGQGGDEGTASIRFKGITFTPGGFLAAESVTRSRAAQADVNTPFTGIPFPGNDLSRITESNFSGRQSRLSFLAEGKADNVKLSGYYEMDWLGACVTSNSRQSNSYCNRQRQLWGQGAFNNGFTVTGGQQWSLATETRKGMDNRTEALPMTIDAQYNVGFTWQRQYGFRVTKNFENKLWLGFSVEEPQITLTQHATPTGFLVGGVGAGGGLLNFADTTGYSNNKLPDFIIKAVYEPGRGHYEVFGIISTFRDRVYPCAVATPTTIVLPAVCGGVASPGNGTNAFTSSSTGGGLGVNLRAPVTKQFDLGVHFLGGSGIGRYSSAQLPDITIRPDGTIAQIRGGGALGTAEFHPSPKLDIYLNYGIEYAFRAGYTFTNAAGTVTTASGYGSALFNQSGCEALPPGPAGTGAFANGNIPAGFNPSSAGGCTGDLRNIQEGTIGFWHKLYQGPKGGLRWGIQYSYIFKNTWSGTGGVTGKAIDNMVFTSFRYYIP